MPITTIAVLPIKQGYYAKVVKVIGDTVPESHKEPGILRLAFHKGEAGEELLVAVESYRDEEAIAAHLATPHLKQVAETLPECLSGPIEFFHCDPFPAGDPVMGEIALPAPRSRKATGLVVVSVFTVQEKALEKALGLLVEDAVATHKEPGVHRFAIHLDREVRRRVVVLEAYENSAVLDAHFKTPHLAKVVRELVPLFDGENRLIRLTPLGIGDPDKGML